jgi:hypothetical protein
LSNARDAVDVALFPVDTKVSSKNVGKTTDEIARRDEVEVLL